jgi:predicted alpha/beta-hydrolase family hydrolase
MYSIRYLDILGHRDEPVPHTFFQQEKAPSHIAIILPGMGYTSHMPLLYYPARLMLNRGADVLQLQYEYSRKDDFASLDGEGKRRWLMTDVSKACRAVLERRSYGKITLVGKSMGTRAMGHFLSCEVKPYGSRSQSGGGVLCL